MDKLTKTSKRIQTGKIKFMNDKRPDSDRMFEYELIDSNGQIHLTLTTSDNLNFKIRKRMLY